MNTLKQPKQLIFFGILLILISLIIGIAAPNTPNPLSTSSSQTEVFYNGIYLIIIGLIWDKILLSESWLRIIFWLTLYGTFIKWISLLVATAFNVGGVLEIVMNKSQGPPMAEGFVAYAYLTLLMALLMTSVLILIGIWNNLKTEVD